MNWLSNIESLFNIDKSTITVDESLRDFTLLCHLLTLALPDKSLFSDLLKSISSRDSFEFIIIIGNGSPTILNNASQINDFISNLNEKKGLIEDESISLKFHIYKKRENDIITIYCLRDFTRCLTKLPLVNVLKLFAIELSKSPRINFQFYEDYASFGTRHIYFGIEPKTADIFDQREISEEIRENCNFGNIEEYRFGPDYFGFTNLNPDFPDLNILFEKLTLLFSIISLFNITSLDDIGLRYKLIGYKVFEGVIRYENIQLDSKETYYKIFNWVYSEKNKVSDKLGLARNVLSLSLKSGSIDIDESVFLSIKSSYEIYLKENINRYIETRNKITEQLLVMSDSASRVIGNYVDNFKRSLFALLSFFISVIVLRVLSNGGFDQVMTKDATILSLAFLGISVFFLCFSLLEFSISRRRLEEIYSNIKDRFTDLLIREDIERILNNDKDFKDLLKFIKKQKRLYTILWILVLFVILSAIFTISTYINWNTLWLPLKIFWSKYL